MAAPDDTGTLQKLDPAIKAFAVLGLASGIGLIIAETVQVLGVLLVIFALVSLLALVHNRLSE